MVMMNTTDTKAECQGKKLRLSTAEVQEQLNLTTLELAGQEDTIQLHVDLYRNPDNNDFLFFWIRSDKEYVAYHVMFSFIYESFYETEELKITCREDDHINMTTTTRTAKQFDPSPRSIILKLESTQVTVTETTTGIDTTGPLVCPITKHLPDPKYYQLLLKCSKNVKDCGHAFICTEGGVPGWYVVLLVVMTVLMLSGCLGCLYYRRKAIANRPSSNNGGGAGIEGQHYHNHKQHQKETHPKHHQDPHPKHHQEPHPKHHQEPHPKHHQEPHPKHHQEPHPKHHQKETHPKHHQEPHPKHPQEPHHQEPHPKHPQEPHPQQEEPHHQGASRTSSYNSINSIYQAFQSNTE
ncbi:hypothetical protein Pcinc_042247 [Petrolisthes cinctipes]|uniref:Uncharacterized protein n=1 Tax=Petrolisthes cinctipes TaxID=88211 RepID=A0AAE1BHU8_PETCI|nr:hypothetical protein Pcinc_042247 [Petrolisthes cinctipes]